MFRYNLYISRRSPEDKNLENIYWCFHKHTIRNIASLLFISLFAADIDNLSSQELHNFTKKPGQNGTSWYVIGAVKVTHLDAQAAAQTYAKEDIFFSFLSMWKTKEEHVHRWAKTIDEEVGRVRRRHYIKCALGSTNSWENFYQSFGSVLPKIVKIVRTCSESELSTLIRHSIFVTH